MLIWCLRLFFSIVLLTMLGTTLWAGSQENMFQLPPRVLHDPWFIATLGDAYFGFLTFYLWVCYRSRSWASRLVWLLLILAFGNMAMATYALWILFRLPVNAGMRDVLLGKKPYA